MRNPPNNYISSEISPQKKERTLDAVLKDYDNPLSLINLLPTEVSKWICELPEEWIDIPEEDLEKLIPRQNQTVEQIRILFWREYDRCVELRTKMNLARTYTGILTRTGFYKILKDPEKLAWIINPPKEYVSTIEEMHSAVLRQIRDIINLPNISPSGFVDTKLADVKLKIMIALDMRLKGGYVHKSMQITHNVNKNESTLSITHDAGTNSDATGNSLDDQIKLLEAEIKATEEKLLENKSVNSFSNNLLSNKQLNAVSRMDVFEAEFSEVKDDSEK